MREMVIQKPDESQRLDKFLLKYLNSAGKGFVYKMLRKKNITLNGKKAEGHEMLRQGDCIRIFFSEETFEKMTEEKKINRAAQAVAVVFEDENILVCNKPPGLLSHSDGSEQETLTDRILNYLNKNHEYEPSKTSVFTPALCNRLDRNTSGLTVCGKNLAAVQWLNRAFAAHAADKRYRTIVKGSVKEAGVLEGFHVKDQTGNQVRIFSERTGNAKKVLTEYNPLRVFSGFSLLEVQLHTGKSHQIRAQLQAAGYPVVGDAKYGEPNINAYVREKFGLRYQLLHAESLVFTERDGALGYLAGKNFTAEKPPVFLRVMKGMGLVEE